MPAKTAEQISSKYQRRVAGAGQDYAEGVQSPARDWSTATIAAKARWQTALQEAMQAGRYEKGVQAAGSQKWQTRALNVGAQRYTGAAAEAAAAFSARAIPINWFSGGPQFLPNHFSLQAARARDRHVMWLSQRQARSWAACPSVMVFTTSVNSHFLSLAMDTNSTSFSGVSLMPTCFSNSW